MISDLFSYPLFCPACWLSPDAAHHSPSICLACPTLPCHRPARRLKPPLDTLSQVAHIVYHRQRHRPAPNCFFHLTCHISLGIISDRHPPTTVFLRRLP